MTRLDIHVKSRLVELRAEGKSIRFIATELGLSKTTVCKHLIQLESEVSNASSFAKEALLEEFKTTRLSILRNRLRLLQRIEDQIEKRDLGEVSSDRLIRLAIELAEIAKPDLLFHYRDENSPLRLEF